MTDRAADRKMIVVDNGTREIIRELARAEGRDMWKVVERAVTQYANRSRDYQNALNQSISARGAS